MSKISINICLFLLVSICLGLLVFPGSLLLIKQFGEIRKITAESMMPTLHINDRLIVQRIHGLSEIRRGELVVYYPPFSILESDPMSVLLRETGLSSLINDKESGKDVAYVHRVLGLPGDKIEIRPGKGLFINGKLLNEPYISEVATSCTFIKPKPLCKPITVPNGKLFILGDNRNLSLDSRYWGWLDVERLHGKAICIFDPPERAGQIAPPKY